jgi:hypothetical protein
MVTVQGWPATNGSGVFTARTIDASGNGLYQDYRRSGTDGYAAAVTDTVQRLTGHPARSLDDLIGELAPGR